MDHFQASVHAFTRALESWHEIGFREGIVTSWNNLASLYEELRLFSRADHCYQRALENLDESLDREIRFYLHLNYAAFSHLRKNSSQAEEHLGKASELQEVSPGKFLLLEARVLGTRNRLAQLLSFRPQLPSLRIERALLLGEFFQQDGQSREARNYLEEALEEARESRLRYFIRASALQLGEWMEDAQQYDEAARLYLSTLSSEYNVAIPEVVFPIGGPSLLFSMAGSGR